MTLDIRQINTVLWHTQKNVKVFVVWIIQQFVLLSGWDQGGSISPGIIFCQSTKPILLNQIQDKKSSLGFIEDYPNWSQFKFTNTLVAALVAANILFFNIFWKKFLTEWIKIKVKERKWKDEVGGHMIVIISQKWDPKHLENRNNN